MLIYIMSFDYHKKNYKVQRSPIEGGEKKKKRLEQGFKGS